MLYHLAAYWTASFSFLNVVHYVSFRALAGLLTTVFLSFLTGSWFIEQAKKHFRSKAREWTPESHRAKDNLPTMGGLFILAMVLINTLLWCDLTNSKVWLMLIILVGFGLIGALDDWAKITKSKGISARAKFWLQCLIAALVVGYWVVFGGALTTVTIPFFKSLNPDLGWFFMLWAVFIIVGTSNAVNLTDGLDGLAIGSLMPNFATFAILSYLAGNLFFADYLHIPFAGTAEVAIIGTILMGASLGFLWYNAYPAQIFMGDVGSLALGAVLAFMALLCKQEILLIVAGGLFVVETLSVILQLLSFRFRKKRIFKMAPIHHHFELIGWAEAKITVRFAIITLLLCIIALMTVKVR